ncbi:hypothetical protein PINS_up008599 [Pythium insidiosum]|nr:hypothetical protein PINS_up008599 [Pythium insidiosum]
MFPSGLVDAPSLRALSRTAAKTKGARKSSMTPKTSPKSPAAAGKRKSPSAPAPTPAVAPAETPAPPPKRSIKPFKSRMMDEAPSFMDRDFEEKVA